MDYKFLKYIQEKESTFLKRDVNGHDLITITDANNYFNGYMDQLGVCGVPTLPNIKSKEFKNWLKDEFYVGTNKKAIYKRGGVAFDIDILYKHFCNVIEFSN
ncbi:unnamed protein product [marine sediment metagenome]|uniref:Uncharacterized protein n=1 Tax=marine sediment metagenome TaxID=412755 RepID=X0X4B5_9ZZZZ